MFQDEILEYVEAIEKSIKAKIDSLQSERDHLKNRLAEVEDAQRRRNLEYEAEKEALLKGMELKDRQIAAKELDHQANDDLIAEALASADIPDVQIFELIDADIEFVDEVVVGEEVHQEDC